MTDSPWIKATDGTLINTTHIARVTANQADHGSPPTSRWQTAQRRSFPGMQRRRSGASRCQYRRRWRLLQPATLSHPRPISSG